MENGKWKMEKGEAEPEPLYRVHHGLSRFRGCIVRLRIRPSSKRRPNNVLAETIDRGERFVCPWRGLRRVPPLAEHVLNEKPALARKARGKRGRG